ncbi:type II secretion system protein GspC [Thalassotalea sp. G2M2-11]|uniref:type II secretion system protein GspC n=1 Tax=Thalassotalea sp. G2M2-11 TaxID=2787627 RepID=UPI0019D14A4F|nr:type II secretion system protein GspC [Thalassotalea sp. G2M2-11]
MGFPKDLATAYEVLLKLPQQKIAKVISALLLCYIAYLCAKLTWLLVPQQQVASAPVFNQGQQLAQAQSAKIDIASIIQLNLFGEYNATPKVVEVKVQDAPETNLRLKLTGTVASDKPEIAAAIIEQNGKQTTYGVGDKIEGTRATLESVAQDRVLIKQSGRLETLMLDGFKYNKMSSSLPSVPSKRPPVIDAPSKPQVIDQRDNQLLSESAKQLKEDINNDPGKIIDHLKIVPKRSDGTIIGYQLMPGKNPEFFKASGLKSGDIAVQMNGLDLTNPSEAAQALQALKEQTDLSLLVLRGNEMTEILFSIEE